MGIPYGRRRGEFQDLTNVLPHPIPWSSGSDGHCFRIDAPSMPTSRVRSADTHTWQGLAVFMTMRTRRQLLRRRVVVLASLAAWFPIVTSAGGCISRTPARPASESAAAELLAQSAAGRRLLGLVRAVNAGDSSSILGFARAHYDSVALAESGGNARMLARWGEVRSAYGPLEIDTIISVAPAIATVWLRGTISRSWLFVRLVTDSIGDRRVRSIGLGRGSVPAFADGRNIGLIRTPLPAYLDEYMRRLSDAGLFSGVVALAHADSILFQRTYGFADRDRRAPMRMDTPFDIASIGKTFTAVGVAQLAERGALRLADTVGRFLPQLPRAIAGRVTIAHLLEHSSGLGELGAGLDSAMRRSQSVGEMIALAGRGELAFPPGTDVSYSNRGYILLGGVIERASGTRYDEYLRRALFQPAQMTRTGIYPANALPADRAHRYTHFESLRATFAPALVEFAPENDLAPGPHGGAYSTAPDLLRYARALTRGTLVGAEWVDSLVRDPANTGRSRGFEVGAIAGRRYFGHLGGAPGMNSMLRVFPELGYTLVVLSNFDSGANVAGTHISEMIR